jgi:LuxR family transcriptional regulator, regulator of acetate metabolism
VNADIVTGSAIDGLLPERLWRMRRVTGLPVAYGGPALEAPDGPQVVLTRLSGTLGESLRGLTVPTGRGLGGLVLCDKMPRQVRNYATEWTITHEFAWQARSEWLSC